MGAYVLEGPWPVVLVDPARESKTRLLWQIARDLEKHDVAAALQFITPALFPPEARRLAQGIDELAPDQAAVLLVDDLDRIADPTAGVLALIGVFLEAGRPVVIGTGAPPDAIPPLSAKWRMRFERGDVHVIPEPGAAPSEGSLAGALDELHACHEAAMRQLREGLSAASSLLSAMRDAPPQVSVRPAPSPPPARESGAESSSADFDAWVHELAAALDKRNELAMQQWETLAGHIEAFLDQSVASFSTSDAQHLHEELLEARALGEAFRLQLTQDRRRFEERLAAAQAETRRESQLLENARAEHGRLRVALDQARGRVRALEEELRGAYKQISLSSSEMDALRLEAASQVASAQVQVGELQHRVQELERALPQDGGAAPATGLSDDLARIAQQLRDAAGSGASGGGNPGGADQSELFDAGEYTPPAGRHSFLASGYEAPHPGASLEALIREALDESSGEEDAGEREEEKGDAAS